MRSAASMCASSKREIPSCEATRTSSELTGPSRLLPAMAARTSISRKICKRSGRPAQACLRSASSLSRSKPASLPAVKHSIATCARAASRCSSLMTARAAAISRSDTRPSDLARWPMTRKVIRKNCSPMAAGDKSGGSLAASSSWWPRRTPRSAPNGPRATIPSTPPTTLPVQRSMLAILASASDPLLRAPPNAMPTPTIHRTDLAGLEKIYEGKVRDLYRIDARYMLMVATDRLSAFDVVLPDPIPDKGRVLNSISNFWFAKTRHLVPNHLSGRDITSAVADPEEAALLADSAVIVRRLKPLPIEAVVRGYLIGSGL